MERVKRSAKLAFYGVTSGAETVYHRMKGFTSLSTSKNPKEYTRQYTDMDFEETDIIGYSPSIGFDFDLYKDSAVHQDIAEIFDKEKIGDAAIREIVVVDLTSPAGGENSATYTARMRQYAVVPSDEGGNLDRYNYTGTFKVKGDMVEGTATTNDEWQTITFTPAE